jgi:hypothetical protein
MAFLDQGRYDPASPQPFLPEYEDADQDVVLDRVGLHVNAVPHHQESIRNITARLFAPAFLHC